MDTCLKKLVDRVHVDRRNYFCVIIAGNADLEGQSADKVEGSDRDKSREIPPQRDAEISGKEEIMNMNLHQ